MVRLCCRLWLRRARAEIMVDRLTLWRLQTLTRTDEDGRGRTKRWKGHRALWERYIIKHRYQMRTALHKTFVGVICLSTLSFFLRLFRSLAVLSSFVSRGKGHLGRPAWKV